MKASIRQVNGVLGITVPDDDIIRILTNLDMAPEISGDELTIRVPAYREDMESYQDIAEELIREYGYDHVVGTLMPTAAVTAGGTNLQQKIELKLKQALCGTGASEAIHYSFFSPADLDLLKLPEDAPERHAIRIMNPINEDLSLMRTTLVPQMIAAIARNQKRGNLSGRLFEIGRRFIAKELPLKEYPDERPTICVGVFGESETFFTLKGIAEEIADALFLKFSYRPAVLPFLHPYQTADVFCGEQKVGYIGKLAYDIAEAENMRADLYLMELDLASLYPLCGQAPAFEPLPKFLDVTRDLALVMDKEITCAQVEEEMRAACKYVRDIKLFDVYEGVPIPPTMKSMAFTVTFRAGEEEFTSEDVDRFVAKILKKLNAAHGIVLRS